MSASVRVRPRPSASVRVRRIHKADIVDQNIHSQGLNAVQEKVVQTHNSQIDNRSTRAYWFLFLSYLLSAFSQTKLREVENRHIAGVIHKHFTIALMPVFSVLVMVT